MTKENQRIAISKYFLKEGLLRLLKKKHISKISVSELCREAEINRTTFYRHYETPQDVLAEMALDFVKNFQSVPADSKNNQDIKSFCTQWCRYIHEHSDTVKMFLQNDVVNYITPIFQSVSESFLGTRTILYRGRPVDDDTLQMLTSFYASGMHSLINQWLIKNISKTPEEIAELIYYSCNNDFTFK